MLICWILVDSSFELVCRWGQLTEYYACWVIVVCSHAIACHTIRSLEEFPGMVILVKYCVVAMTFAIGLLKCPDGIWIRSEVVGS